jgi:hypothetical protein
MQLDGEGNARCMVYRPCEHVSVVAVVNAHLSPRVCSSIDRTGNTRSCMSPGMARAGVGSTWDLAASESGRGNGRIPDLGGHPSSARHCGQSWTGSMHCCVRGRTNAAALPTRARRRCPRTPSTAAQETVARHPHVAIMAVVVESSAIRILPSSRGRLEMHAFHLKRPNTSENDTLGGPAPESGLALVVPVDH